MNRKICIITGANSGIGKAAAAQIAEKGFHVIMVCRSPERGQSALDDIRKSVPSGSLELMIADMSLRESIIKFVDEFKKKYDRLDVLIHNAALFSVTQKKREITSEGIETVWATNHLGPVLMTELLLDCLGRSDNGRILTVSSKGLLAKPFLKVNLMDPECGTGKYNVVNAYYQSKRAQVMYTYRLADRLKNTGITANSIRVTAVKLDISRHPDLSAFMKWAYKKKEKLSISPEEMAETYTYLSVHDNLKGVSGKYFDEHNNEVKSNKYSRDKKNIDAVMKLTKEYVPEIKENQEWQKD